MMPLRQLLSRIRWDREFGNGHVVLGYEDHVAGKLVLVDMEKVRMDPASRFFFDITDEDGRTLSIPFHRVRQVYKDGKLIWERSPR